MTIKKETLYVRGEAHWAKVLGKPRKNTFTEENEWTIDVSLDKEGLKTFKDLGISDRLKSPKEGDNRGKFYTFKQRELRADKITKNEPIKIVDAKGQPWNPDTLIGNGSMVDVKFVFQPADGLKKAGVYIRSIRVLKLDPYVSQEFAPLSEDDEFFAEGADESDASTEYDGEVLTDELDDEIPE